MIKPKAIKILLVEDEPLVLMIHQKMLAELGFKADTAHSGEEALAMADNHYDLIFMDIGLPGMSGTEAAAEIRRRETAKRQAFIVAITAYPKNEIQATCDAAGIDMIKNKPLLPNEFGRIIEESAKYQIN